MDRPGQGDDPLSQPAGTPAGTTDRTGHIWGELVWYGLFDEGFGPAPEAQTRVEAAWTDPAGKTRALSPRLVSPGVYEVDSIGLSRIVSALNRGEDWNGRAIDAPT